MVFPARAGMSPVRDLALTAWHGVPRASGDEPQSTVAQLGVKRCSPRERG